MAKGIRDENHPNRQVGRERFDNDALARSMAHYPMYGPPHPKWAAARPNFEGIPGGSDDPYDADRDRRLTRERGG